MPGKLRYGCVGAGGIADKKHLNEYSKLNNVELTAVCDTSLKAAERLAEKYGVPRVYQDYNEMFEKEQLDIISVCTPNFLHMPVSVAALEKGINVHCEKPIALNTSEAQVILDAKKKSGKKLMIALNNRFTREAQFIKRYALEGLLGEIYHAKCGWVRRSGLPGKGLWFTNKKLSGGGPMIDLGVHFLDLTMYLMGYPEVSSVSGATYCKFADCASRIRPGYKIWGDGIFDVEDMSTGFVRLQNGATIDFDFSWASNIEKESKYCHLIGTKGGASFINGELKVFSEAVDTCITITPEMNNPAIALNEFEHFADCVINDKEPIATAEEAVKLMKVIDAIYVSADSKREVIL